MFLRKQARRNQLVEDVVQVLQQQRIDSADQYSIKQAIFLPEGRRILSVGSEGIGRIWHIVRGVSDTPAFCPPSPTKELVGAHRALQKELPVIESLVQSEPAAAYRRSRQIMEDKKQSYNKQLLDVINLRCDVRRGLLAGGRCGITVLCRNQWWMHHVPASSKIEPDRGGQLVIRGPIL